MIPLDRSDMLRAEYRSRINRVIDYMRERDWLGYLDPEHLNIVAETSALVDGRADLRERLPQLPLTSHETAFENVLAALAR